jgi:hypothetical protein
MLLLVTWCVVMLVFHAYIKEMRGSRSKNLVLVTPQQNDYIQSSVTQINNKYLD